MLSYERAQRLLTEMTDAIPAGVFAELNGGILLLPDCKEHPRSIAGSLYILGEYHYEPNGFGRYITIYHGSLCKTRGDRPYQEQVDKLREILHHELTHHLEHLAGDISLEKRDAAVLAEYCRKYA